MGAGVTYTVPQKIRPAHVEKGVDLFFRVDNVYRNRRNLRDLFRGGAMQLLQGAHGSG